jgi:hypothetical protein
MPIPSEENSAILGPTPTPSGQEITAFLTVSRCLRWLETIIRNTEYYPEIRINVILAIMAQESGCISDAHNGVSVGLMAITPRSWTPTWEELLDPDTNIDWGTWFLASAINNETYNPNHSLYRALGAYNCGWRGLERNACGSTGGYIYARRILYYWVPIVNERLDLFCTRQYSSIYYINHQEWLRENGYCQ